MRLADIYIHVLYFTSLQVSQVYQTIEFSKLLSLIPFANEFQLERAIVDVAKQNDLQVL